MNIFSKVKAAINMRQAAIFYGLKVNHHGMTCCPFHNDHTPSLKLNDSYFYCFGCHEHGDVINFAAKLHGLGQQETAVKLTDDFNIDISEYREPKARAPSKPRNLFKSDLKGLAEKLSNIRGVAAEREKANWLRRAEDDLNRYRLLIYDWNDRYAPLDDEEEWHPLFKESCHQLEMVEYLCSLLDDPLRRDSLYTEYKEEIDKIHDRITNYKPGAGNGHCA